jgi:hypothetical protein
MILRRNLDALGKVLYSLFKIARAERCIALDLSHLHFRVRHVLAQHGLFACTPRDCSHTFGLASNW